MSKANVESLDEIGQLKQAIDTNDLARGVISPMTRNPGLHHAPLGYGRNGPLTLSRVRTFRHPRYVPITFFA
jgi:hypothetical protein